MELWIGVLIAVVLGFGLGVGVTWWITRKQAGGTSVTALQEEHAEFREQVSAHFIETADLINRLTDSYKDVFDHLSKGAETLVDEASLRERMPQVSDQEVRLKRIGARSATESDAATRRASSTPSPSTPAKTSSNKAGATVPEASSSPDADEALSKAGAADSSSGSSGRDSSPATTAPSPDVPVGPKATSKGDSKSD